MKIASLDTALYRIELPVPLSDSTHGTMTHFELVTVRLRDEDGAEGVGYTYTTGAGGAAVHALIDQGLRPVLIGADPGMIESLWQKMWWKLHYGGRGGSVSLAVSAADIALYDLKARRLWLPLLRMLGGFDPADGALLRRWHRPGVHIGRVVETNRRQPRQRVPRDQNESRPRQTVGRRGAGESDARPPRRRLSPDGGCEHEMDGGPIYPRRPSLPRQQPDLAGGADDPRRYRRPHPHRS